MQAPPMAEMSVHDVFANADDYRQKMLKNVRTSWIDDGLNESLHSAALIALGLSEQRDAVANPFRLMLQQQNQPPSLLSPGTHITQVYNDTHGGLLILGEPGSGKTTLLLELTRSLLDSAKQNGTDPIPVVFNLSSWAIKRRPLNEWLIEELNAKYQIPRKICQWWVGAEKLLLLLDGLDEVALNYREACIDAINVYRREHSLCPIVVCCRRAEYKELKRRLLLQSAVMVQPLTPGQIEEYLSSAGEKLEGVRKALAEDKELQELAKTPLMLSIITLAYPDAEKPVETFSKMDSLATRRRQIFDAYVQRMFSIQKTGPHYTQQQSVYWLSWLARQLVKQKQTGFYLEQLQLDKWLVKSRPAEIYTSLAFALLSFPVAAVVYGLEYSIYGLNFAFVNGTLAGLTTAIIAFFFVWFIEADIRMEKLFPEVSERVEPIEESKNPSKLATFLSQFLVERVAFALLSGLLQGIVVEFLVGPFYSLINGVFIAAFLVVLGKFKREIQTAGTLVWSWESVWKHALESLLQGLAIGVFGGIVNAFPYLQHVSIFLATLCFWLSLGAALGVIMMLMHGFSSDELDLKMVIKPNQGIRNALSNSLRLGLSSGTLLGLVIFFFYSYVIHNVFVVGYVNELPTYAYIIYGVGGALGVAYLFWLIKGGFATVQHLVLRIYLCTTKYTPWRYPRFLDFAVDHILLRRAGGGYMFTHRQLQEYFAALYNEVTLPENDEVPNHSTPPENGVDAGFIVQKGQKLWNQYQVGEIVGFTKHSQVARAWDEALQRDVAIKFFYLEKGNTNKVAEQLSKNLLREARLLVKLEHRNIGKVYAAMQAPPLPAIIMQWIEGGSLQEVLDEKTEIPVADVIKIGIELAEALNYIHAQGITHRDIKPNNIILSEGGEAILIDFDIARFNNLDTITYLDEGSYAFVGNLRYSAPEQFVSPESVGPPADIFALGVVLYELLAYQLPYKSNDPKLYRGRQLPSLASEYVPEQLYPLFCEVLSQDLENRPDALQLKERLRAHAIRAQAQNW